MSMPIPMTISTTTVEVVATASTARILLLVVTGVPAVASAKTVDSAQRSVQNQGGGGKLHQQVRRGRYHQAGSVQKCMRSKYIRKWLVRDTSVDADGGIDFERL